MATRPKTGKRQLNGNSFTNRKIAPVHFDQVTDDRKANSTKTFKDEKYTAGMRALEKHDYVDAAKQFSLIKPDTISSLYFTGCARLEIKCYSQLKEALQNFTKCMTLASKTRQPMYDLEVWYKRAQTFYYLRQYNEAISDYNEFLSRCRSAGGNVQAEFHRGLIGRGQTYQGMMELDMAMQDIGEANHLTKDKDPYFLCCRASIHAAKHETDKALEDLKRADDIGGDNDHEALFRKGIVLADLGKHKPAIGAYSKALPITPKPAEQSDICVRTGMSYYALNDKSEALRSFERAVTLHPYNAEAYYRRGIVQNEKGLYKVALKSLDEAHELAPEDGNILLERAMINEQLGRPSEAEQDRRKGEKLNSSSIAVTSTLDDRIKKLHEENDRIGDSARSHLELAMSYDGLINQKRDSNSKMEHYRNAVMEYQAAMENDTKHFYPQAGALLTLCHQKMNDLNAAYETQLEFYHLLDQHQESIYHWKAYLADVKDKMETRKLEPYLDDHLVKKLVHMELNRTKQGVDINTFQNDLKDKNKNQLAFYEQMRMDLSSLLAAIGMFSLSMDKIIHNVDQTSNKVGKIVKLIIEGEKSIPTIESALNHSDQIHGDNLRKIDYDLIKMRLRSLGNVGDIIDQLDVAQLVARHLCTRYRSQLMCLSPKNQTVEVSTPSPGWNCCGRSKQMTSSQKDHVHVMNTIRDLSTFAIAFIIQAINSDAVRLSAGNSSRKDALATTLVLLVCQAHLTTMGSSSHHKTRSLPINSNDAQQMLKTSRAPKIDENPASIHWDFYEFFRAPGIFYHSDGDTGKARYYGSGASMLAQKYGYRLGTKEEVDVFKKLNGDKE